MTTGNTWRRALYTLSFLLLVGSGCGTRTPPLVHPVEGTVTLNGTPLAEVQVQFVPETEQALPTALTMTDAGFEEAPSSSNDGTGFSTVFRKLLGIPVVRLTRGRPSNCGSALVGHC